MLWVMFIQILLSVPEFAFCVTTFKIGVPIVSKSEAPNDIERIGAAIHIAFEKVNKDFLNSDYQIQKVERHYGRTCSPAKAPGEYN